MATVAKGQFSFLLQESLLFSFSRSISIKDLLRNYLIVDKIYLSDLFLTLGVISRSVLCHYLVQAAFIMPIFSLHGIEVSDMKTKLIAP